jgi:putative restriction endonuclease
LKFYAGITDFDWFRTLAERTPDEVNFWRSGAHAAFKAIDIGAPFLFKLYSPQTPTPVAETYLRGI